MTLSVKEQTAIARLRTKIKKQHQGSIAESLGVGASALSGFKQVMRAIGVDCPSTTRGAKPSKTTLSTATMAKSLRSSKSNGAHAR